MTYIAPTWLGLLSSLVAWEISFMLTVSMADAGAGVVSPEQWGNFISILGGREGPTPQLFFVYWVFRSHPVFINKALFEQKYGIIYLREKIRQKRFLFYLFD